jgi:hypothetical protein
VSINIDLSFLRGSAAILLVLRDASQHHLKQN